MSTRDTIKAKKVINRDSPKNCPISCFFWAPKTFFTPISLARFAERAVARFI